ncbi:MAG: hypothetical protein ACJ745_02380, partial [Actinomycetes bacterium]
LGGRLAPADADLAARYPRGRGHQAAGPHRLCPGRPADPRNVLVDGHHVVWDGRLLGADMDTPRRDRARRLWREDAR